MFGVGMAGAGYGGNAILGVEAGLTLAEMAAESQGYGPMNLANNYFRGGNLRGSSIRDSRAIGARRCGFQAWSPHGTARL